MDKSSGSPATCASAKPGLPLAEALALQLLPALRGTLHTELPLVVAGLVMVSHLNGGIQVRRGRPFCFLNLTSEARAQSRDR